MSRTSHYRKRVKPGERKFFVGSIALMFMASFALAMGLFTPAQAVDNTVAVPPVPSGMTYDYPCGDGSGVWTGIPADADTDAYDFKFDSSSPQHLIVVYTNNPIDGKTFPNGTDTYDYGLPADVGMTCQPQDVSVTPTAPAASQPTCDNTTKTVTPDSQSGAIMWDPSGATDLQPGDSVTYTASPADGFVFPDGADTSFPYSNNFDTAQCDNGGGDGGGDNTDYATVTGHEPFSEDANHPDYWGDNCTKIENPGGSSYVLPDGTYTKVIVKAGAGEFANTIFAAPPKAGETVWADTNGNGIYDPGGKDGDKDISHIILCTGETPPPPPTCPEGTTWNDDNHNGTVDEGECVSTPPPPKTCPPGSDWDDQNHNGMVDDGECVTLGPPPKFHCPDGSTPGDVNGDGVTDAADCQVVPPPHPKPKHLPETGFTGASMVGMQQGSSNSGLWFLAAGLCALLSLGSAGSGVVIRRRRDGA